MICKKLLDKPSRKRYHILSITDTLLRFIITFMVSIVGELSEVNKMTNEELYELMKEGFAQVNQRLDQGLENVNQRLDRVEQRLDTMDDRLRTVESGVSELKGSKVQSQGCKVGFSQHVLSAH
ncbi:hypothetical protein C6501_18940 [Candidatus Poribacteria bacterium]|nr:MAG: hypothetical protein C6501_18940 [Candidatus Poribacteria bacterium]